MNNITNYILEKLKINKDSKIDNQGKLISEFCRLTSLNYNHSDNKDFFDKFDNFLDEYHINKNLELKGYADPDDVKKYFGSDYDDIKDSFIDDYSLYKKLLNYIDADPQEGFIIFTYRRNNMRIKCVKSPYGILLSYDVSNLVRPFIFIIDEK